MPILNKWHKFYCWLCDKLFYALQSFRTLYYCELTQIYIIFLLTVSLILDATNISKGKAIVIRLLVESYLSEIVYKRDSKHFKYVNVHIIWPNHQFQYMSSFPKDLRRFSCKKHVLSKWVIIPINGYFCKSYVQFLFL